LKIPCLRRSTTFSHTAYGLFSRDTYDQREKISIFAQTEGRAAAIDRLLWINKQEAFIPHEIFKCHEPESSVPVAIVSSELNPIGAGILVADGHCSLGFAVGLDLVHEIVNRSSPEMQEACRDRFRAYRSRQISVEYSK
jgi:DNA polymerase IIIc chi subunit